MVQIHLAMKRVISAWVLASLLLCSWAKPNKRTTDYTPNNVFYGVWKYDQVFSNDPFNNGVAKKEYLLKLNQDGTYLQTVHIVPEDKKFYAGPLVYQLEGTWQLKDNVLYIEEHGNNYPVELTALRDKFIYFGGEMPTAETK
jgi:hypothetical protein